MAALINVFFDTEADGLLHEWEPEAATRIDCTCALVEDHTGCVFLGDWEGVCYTSNPDDKVYVIGHNIFDYDLPMLKKFKGWKYDILPDRLNGHRVEFVDTLILSKLLNPDRPYPDGFCEQWEPSYKGQKLPGPHSLAVWAYRVHMIKPQLVYGDKMGNVPYEVSVAQCKADCEITRAVYYALIDEARELGVKLKEPLKCEQAVRHIQTLGVIEGVPFNAELAKECIIELDEFMKELADVVEPQLPSKQLCASKIKYPPKQKFKKDGNPTAKTSEYFGNALKQVEEQEAREDTWIIKDGEELIKLKDWPADRAFGDYTAPMTMADQAEIKQWLMEEHGWRPTLWNTVEKDGKKVKTSPKFHQQGNICENLLELGDVVPVVEDIIKWLSYRNRRNVICSNNGTGWLHHPRLAIDGRLPADADTMGTGTFRYSHKVVANIPRPSSLYGEKMRSLFIADEGDVLVGWDAAQLEDRCKGHYCFDYPGGGDYANKLIDPNYSAHDQNVAIWGQPKPKCKNGHFALQYGCRPPKLAETLGVSLDIAEDWWNDWWDRNFPLKCFVERIEEVWASYDQKWLPAIDGRLVPTRKQHALANTLFQSAGVIAMKYAMVYWWVWVRELGIPAVQIIHYHDEAVAITSPEYADKVAELGVKSILKAGEKLGFRVPLTAEAKIGHSWCDIH